MDSFLHDASTCLATIPQRTSFPTATITGENSYPSCTGGSGKTDKAVTLWKNDKGQWEHLITFQPGSTQLVKLAAMVEAFRIFSQEPVNIVCDSLYVVRIIERIEHSFLKEVSNKDLFVLLITLYNFLLHRSHEYYLLHLRSHTTLSGPIVEDNARADALAIAVTIPQKLGQAKLSHDFYHQNTQALAKQLSLTSSQAWDIVNTCSQYQQTLSLPQTLGTNPRGLKPNDIWQTDVTHILSFGALKYVHVSFDTFSGFIVATAHKGEKSRDATQHWLCAFTMMGVPQWIKTNNGPAYTPHKTQEFFHTWGIKHVTGIAHSPTGRATVERAHYTLKNMLQKQKRGNPIVMLPQGQLDKTTYILNFLNLSTRRDLTAP